MTRFAPFVLAAILLSGCASAPGFEVPQLAKPKAGARAKGGDGAIQDAIRSSFGGKVRARGATDGQALVWSAGTRTWIPGEAGGGLPDGDLTLTGDLLMAVDDGHRIRSGDAESSSLYLGGNLVQLLGDSLVEVQGYNLTLTGTNSLTASSPSITLTDEIDTSVYVDVSGVTVVAPLLGGNGVTTQVGFLASVEDSVAGSGAPNVLTAGDSGTTVTNYGTTVENFNELPGAEPGLLFRFVCVDADGIRATAVGDDTIRFMSLVTEAAGYVRSATVGSVIIVLGISSTEWIAVGSLGSWTASPE